MDYQQFWCWGSADHEHRFWLFLRDGRNVCINCHVERLLCPTIP